VKQAEEEGEKERIKDPTSVNVVGSEDLNLAEVIEMCVDLGNVQTTVRAHIVPTAPVDILLGQNFLKKFSKGYHLMLQELGIKDDTEEEQKQSLCVVDMKEKLE